MFKYFSMSFRGSVGFLPPFPAADPSPALPPPRFPFPPEAEFPAPLFAVLELELLRAVPTFPPAAAPASSTCNVTHEGRNRSCYRQKHVTSFAVGPGYSNDATNMLVPTLFLFTPLKHSYSKRLYSYVTLSLWPYFLRHLLLSKLHKPVTHSWWKDWSIQTSLPKSNGAEYKTTNNERTLN